MKNLRQLCAAAVLTFVLTISASAGVMETGIVEESNTEPNAAAFGVMETGFAEDSIIEGIFDFIQSLF